MTINEIQNMYYEDFHELFYMAYLQATTDEGRKQRQNNELEDQIEELSGSQYGPMDMGLAIKDAVNKREQQRR
jgi:hypothetical protein